MVIPDGLNGAGSEDDGPQRLERDAARAWLGAVLDGRASDPATHAWADRAAAETLAAETMAGFVDAVRQRCLGWAVGRPAVVLPSYGRPGRLPNLTALLAMRLAQEGVAVLVHGTTAPPGEVSTAAIFHDLGLPTARCADDLAAAWARHEPAFVPIEAVCPVLARCIGHLGHAGPVRLGRRLAAWVDPLCGGNSLRVVPCADPVDAARVGDFAHRTGDTLMALHSSDGEPVADPRRERRIDVWLHGCHAGALSRPGREAGIADLPLLPLGADAATTALYIQAVAGGEKPAPAPLERQVQLLCDAWTTLAAAPHAAAPARAA
jgi:anthranilate phosphoribosyltransferase